MPGLLCRPDAPPVRRTRADGPCPGHWRKHSPPGTPGPGLVPGGAGGEGKRPDDAATRETRAPKVDYVLGDYVLELWALDEAGRVDRHTYRATAPAPAARSGPRNLAVLKGLQALKALEGT
jgi:hypothetical protein